MSATTLSIVSERRLALGLGVALSLHAGVWLALRGLPVRLERPLLVVTEVDLAPPTPAVAPAPPPPPPPEPTPAPAASRAVPRPAARAPAPAAAAPLHTASEDAPTADEPVRFAVDARGTGYGFGVVAQGGTGVGAGGHAAPAPAAPAAPARDLRAFATPPRLEESDPCRGHFPQSASADRGEVTLELTVSAEGAVREARVLREQPTQQGFGRAALTCLRAKRFLPARDAGGSPTPALAPVSVRFAR